MYTYIDSTCYVQAEFIIHSLLEMEGVNEFILPVCIKTMIKRGKITYCTEETHQGASGYGGHLTATSVGLFISRLRIIIWVYSCLHR